jgi:AcrR family transcriptional regulator
VDVEDQIRTVFLTAARNSHVDLLVSGLRLFREIGFHGASTRAIARGAGVSDAALYVHYQSKSALLLDLAQAGHVSVLHAVNGALAAADPDPRSRVLAFMSAFATWHAEHSALARVVQYELRALAEPGRSEIITLRRQFETLLRDELVAGVTAGAFHIVDIEATQLAMLSMGIDVARWFGIGRSPDNPRTLGAEYAEICNRMLGMPANNHRKDPP